MGEPLFRSAGGARLFMIVSVLFLHFQITTVAGYAVTAAPICLAILLVKATARSSTPGLVAAFLLTVPGPLVNWILNPLTVSFGEFLKTYLFFVMTVIVVALVLMSDLRVVLSRSQLAPITFAILAFLCALSVVQYLAAKSGSAAFFNLFGSHQYLYRYKAHLEYNFVRSTGLYLEPAINALVILTLTGMLLLWRYKLIPVMVIATAGLVVTRSASGLITLMLLIGLQSLAGRRLGIRLVAGSMVVLVAFLAGPYLVARVASGDEAGSSTNYRLLAPVTTVVDTLVKYPQGAPLGSVTAAVESGGLRVGTVVGSTLDNGYYLIAYYFGLLGLAAIIAYLLWVAAQMRYLLRTKHPWWPVPLILAAAPVFTGSVLTPEYWLLISLLILTMRSIRSQEDKHRDDVSIDHSDRDTQQP